MNALVLAGRIEERSGVEAQASAAASYRRAHDQPCALAASLAVAAEWPAGSPAREAFELELFEEIEALSERGPAAIVDRLTGGDPGLFARAFPGGFGSLTRLLDEAVGEPAAPCGGDEALRAELERRLATCRAIGEPLARLICGAMARRDRYPLEQRIRVVVLDDDARGHVATLALRLAADAGGPGLAIRRRGEERPALCRDGADESVAAGLARLGGGGRACLLDYPDSLSDVVRGPSLGLAAAILSTSALAGGRGMLDTVATGGGGETPFAALGNERELRAKVDGVERFNVWRGRPITRFVVARAEGLVVGPTDIAPPIAVGSDEEIVSALLDLRMTVAALRGRLGALTGPPVDVHLPRAACDRLDRFLAAPDGFVIVIAGEPGAGKSTLARTLAARWNHGPDQRRMAYVSDRGAPFPDGLRMLHDELGVVGTAPAEPSVLTAAIGERLARLAAELDLLVWFVEVSDEPVATIAALEVAAQRLVASSGARTPLRVVLLVRPAGLALMRPSLERLGWPWLDRLELDDADLAAVGRRVLSDLSFAIPPAFVRLCRLGHIWADPTGVAQSQTPLELVDRVTDARRAQFEADHPRIAPWLGRGFARMADTARATLELPSDPTVGEAAGALRVAADGGYLLTDISLLQHCLSRALAERPASNDPAAARSWLARARAPDVALTDVLEDALALAMVRRWSRAPAGPDASELTSFLRRREAAVTHVVARAVAATSTYLPDRGDACWAALETAMPHDPATWLTVLAAIGTQPGAAGLVGEALRHYSAAVRELARVTLQHRLRDDVRALAASSEDDRARRVDGFAERALAPLRRQARSLKVRAPPWRLGGPQSSLVHLLESCLVVVTEAVRADRDLHDGIARRTGALLRGVRARSFWARLALSGAARAFLRVGIVLDRLSAALGTLRQHNPFKYPRDFERFFELPAATRTAALGPFVELMRDPPTLDPRARLARLVGLTEALYRDPRLAFSATNLVVEAAWATLSFGARDELLPEFVDAQRAHYRAVIEDPARHAYAQSCIFSLFRGLWRVEPTSAREQLPAFTAIVRDWHGRRGGVYRTASGQEMQIQHLFRHAALSWRVDGQVGALFAERIASRKLASGHMLEEILHLAEEFHQWSAARELARRLLELVERDGIAQGPSVRTRRILYRLPPFGWLLTRLRHAERDLVDLRGMIRRSLVTLRRVDRAEAAEWERLLAPAASEAVDHAVDDALAPARAATPMLGLSLAFEEATFRLLAVDERFRARYAAWMAGAFSCRSLTSWYGLALELVRASVFDVADAPIDRHATVAE